MRPNSLVVLIWHIALCASVFAQSPVDKGAIKVNRAQEGQDRSDKAVRDAIRKARANGQTLPLNLTVNANVTAEAVIIPANDAMRIFGKEVADHYAVVGITVANKSAEATLIVHGVYVDYSNWALAGKNTPQAPSVPGDRVESQQSRTRAGHAESVESRLVRGQLLDAQQWTARNWTLRILTYAGSIASGYSFAFKEAGIGKAIAAFNGQIVPGMGVLWPDATVQQLNRISDFGYQTNKVVGKEGAEIIVGFFPINWFLTPGFEKLYRKSPAAFFAPLQVLRDGDRGLRKQLENALGQSVLTDLTKLAKALPCFVRYGEQKLRHVTDAPAGEDETALHQYCDAILTPQVLLDLDYVQGASLHNLTVVVDGVMTVDTTALQPKFETFRCDIDDTKPEFWATTGERKCTVGGAYLTGGEFSIQNAGDLGISEVAVIPAESTDSKLQVSFKLGSPIAVGTKLDMTVSKKAQDRNGKPLVSLDYQYVVGYTLTNPAVTGVSLKSGTVTITGNRFFDLPSNNLLVTLHPDSGSDVQATVTLLTPTSFQFDANSLGPGCWTPIVTVGTMKAIPPAMPFAVIPQITVTSAQKGTTQVVITGTSLRDLKACGQPLTVTLVRPDGVEIAAKNLQANGVTATFDLPDDAKTGAWKVHVVLGSGDQTIPLDPTGAK